MTRGDLQADADGESRREPLRFRHVLIRNAAYRRMPKADRADLHERFADWLESEATERIAESEEIIGYHLERSYELRLELRPEQDADRAIAGRAAGRLGSAGRRALGRGDGKAAAGLLDRAVRLEGREGPDGIGFEFELAMALRISGRLSSRGRLALPAGGAETHDLTGIGARIAVESCGSGCPCAPSGVPAEIARRLPG